MDSHFAVAYAAIEQRRHTLAAESMFGSGQRAAIVETDGDAAIARQDMRQPAPVRPSLIARLLTWFVVILCSLAPQERARQHDLTQTAPSTWRQR